MRCGTEWFLCKAYEQPAMASDDGALSPCSDADRIHLPAFLPTATAQSLARLSGGMWYLEYDNRRRHVAPDARNGSRRGLASPVVRRHAVFRIKACHLGRLHESVGRVLGPLACSRKQRRKNAKSPLSGACINCLYRIRRYRLLRWRECISLRDWCTRAITLASKTGGA
jgi:hypothetical protein